MHYTPKLTSSQDLTPGLQKLSEFPHHLCILGALMPQLQCGMPSSRALSSATQPCQARARAGAGAGVVPRASRLPHAPSAASPAHPPTMCTDQARTPLPTHSESGNLPTQPRVLPSAHQMKKGSLCECWASGGHRSWACPHQFPLCCPKCPWPPAAGSRAPYATVSQATSPGRRPPHRSLNCWEHFCPKTETSRPGSLMDTPQTARFPTGSPGTPTGPSRPWSPGGPASPWGGISG